MNSTVHVPILVGPIVEALIEPFLKLPADSPTHYIVDCTLGGGGHTQAFLEAFEAHASLAQHKVIAFDQDESAIKRAQERFGTNPKIEIVHSPFSQAPRHLEGKPVLGLMADLGFSSDQLEDPSRGLSFQSEGPLDMRLDPSRGQSARSYLGQVSETELARVIFEYGEERFSRRIAREIIKARQEGRLPKTTKELSELVVHAFPAGQRHGRIHAATRTFQALRIEINGELNELDTLLDHVILSVKPGGASGDIEFPFLGRPQGQACVPRRRVRALKFQTRRCRRRGDRDQPSRSQR